MEDRFGDRSPQDYAGGVRDDAPLARPGRFRGPSSI